MAADKIFNSRAQVDNFLLAFYAISTMMMLYFVYFCCQESSRTKV